MLYDEDDKEEAGDTDEEDGEVVPLLLSLIGVHSIFFKKNI